MRRSASTKVPLREEGEQVARPQHKVNPAASSIKPREGDEEESSPEEMDEDHGRCEELGKAAPKNLPAYGERHGNKDNAVNWGDPTSAQGEKTL